MSTFELPTLNVELLSNLVNWAVADDQKMNDFLAEKFPDWAGWNQEEWAVEIRNGVCQTAFCIAGQAAVQSGYQIDYTFQDDLEDGKTMWTGGNCYPVEATGEIDDKGNPVFKKSGNNVMIETVGRESIGLEYAEANILFDGGNNIEDVVMKAKTIAAMRGLTLDLIPQADAIADADLDYFAGHWEFDPAYQDEAHRKAGLVIA